MSEFFVIDETAFLDTIPHETFVIDHQGSVLFVNNMWRQRFSNGTTSGTDDLLQRMRASDGETLLALLGAGVANFRLECQIIQSREETRWFILAAQARADISANGSWVCTLTDIDERIKEGFDMRTRAKLRGEMLDASVDCIKVITPDGRLRHLNEAGRVALGIQIDPELSLEMEWIPLLPEEVHTSATEALEAACAGTATRFFGASQLPGCAPQYWDNMLTPVIGEDGTVNCVLCVSREITQQHEAETRLQLAIRASNNAIWDLDLNSGRIVWSDALQAHYGYRLSEIDHSAEWRFERIHPVDRKRARDVIDHAVHNGESDFSHEFRFARADGRYVDVLERGGISRDIRGQAVRIVGTLIDQTDKKAIERSLRKVNRSLKLSARKNLAELSRLWNISRDVLVITDASGVITRVSPALEETLGYPPDSVLGRHLADLTLQEDQQKLRDLLAGDSDQPVETRHQHKNGTLRWIEWIASHSDSKIHAAGRHITIAKEAEIAINQIEERFSKLFRLAPVPMILSSLDGRIWEVNDAFTSLMGYPDSLLDQDGALDSIFTAPGFASSVTSEIDQGGAVRDKELKILTVTGDFVDCLVSMEILSLRDGRCILAAFQDITTRRRGEVELMQAIDTVMKDASWFSQKVIEKLAQIRDPKRVDGVGELSSLTGRERKVLELISGGMSDSEIADSLHLSRYTIRNHLASLYSKLDLHNRSSLIVWARQRGL